MSLWSFINLLWLKQVSIVFTLCAACILLKLRIVKLRTSAVRPERKVEHSAVLCLWWSWENSCVATCESVITRTVESCFLLVSLMFTLKKFQCHSKCCKASFFMTQSLQYGNLNFSKCHQVPLLNGEIWTVSLHPKPRVTTFGQKDRKRKLSDCYCRLHHNYCLILVLLSLLIYLFFLAQHFCCVWKERGRTLPVPQLRYCFSASVKVLFQCLS